MTNDIDGPDDADLASRLWAGDISAAAVDGMQIVTDRLCAQYAAGQVTTSKPRPVTGSGS